MIDPILLQRLRALLGRECLHQGETCRVIDLLPLEGMLVLQSSSARPGIQLDQFGRASHRARAISQIGILGPDGEALSEELQHLVDGLADYRLN